MKDYFRRQGNRGHKIKGWEDVNFLHVSQVMDVSHDHLRRAVRGKDGVSYRLLKQLARTLEMPILEVIERMETASQEQS